MMRSRYLHSSTSATHSGTEPNGGNMKFLRKQFCCRNYSSWEHRANGEAHQGDCNGGDDELRDKPKDELKAHGTEKVYADSHTLPNTTCQKA